MVVGQGSLVANGSFTVSAAETINLNPIPNKKPGEEVTITGETSLEEVSIKVLRPNNTQLYVDVVTSENGIYSNTFTLPEDTALGTYTVVAGQGNTIATTTFGVIDGTVPPLSNNANLSNLVISEGILSPAFAPGTTNYTANVGSNVSSITVTPVAEDSKATITVNGTTVASGRAAAINLSVGSNTITVLVTAEDGTTTKEYTVNIIRRVALTEPEEDITLDEDTKHIEIPGTVEEANINIPAGVEDAAIYVPVQEIQKDGTTVKEATLPKLAIRAERQIGGSAAELQVNIPAGTKVTAPSDWDGTIKMPTVLSNDSVTVSNGNVSAVVEVGLPDMELVFDQAVQLIIPGQAGKAAGFTRGTTVTPITYNLTANTQAAADAELSETGSPREGKIDAGSDLVIWTKHFTKFVSYTPVSSGSGGGGGGGVPAGKTITPAGGTVTEYGVSINFPANTVNSDISVKVEKVTSTSSLPFAADTKLVSNVYEITKTKTGNFLKPVTITIPYDKSQVDTSKYDLGIFWLDKNTTKWNKLDNIKVDLTAGKVSGEVNHFTKFAVLATEKVAVEPAVTLKDLTGHWAENTIKEMVTRGIARGYPDGTFKPDNNITRAEFTVMLVRAFNAETREGKIFADTADHWAKNDIATAASYGFVGGYSDTTFKPDDLINREQMASMIVRAVKLAVVKTS